AHRVRTVAQRAWLGASVLTGGRRQAGRPSVGEVVARQQELHRRQGDGCFALIAVEVLPYGLADPGGHLVHVGSGVDAPVVGRVLARLGEGVEPAGVRRTRRVTLASALEIRP